MSKKYLAVDVYVVGTGVLIFAGLVGFTVYQLARVLIEDPIITIGFAVVLLSPLVVGNITLAVLDRVVE